MAKKMVVAIETITVKNDEGFYNPNVIGLFYEKQFAIDTITGTIADKGIIPGEYDMDDGYHIYYEEKDLEHTIILKEIVVTKKPKEKLA